MENTQTAINTIFGPLMITYFLTFADNGVEVMCDDFVNIDQARDCAWEYSASSNRRINIYESYGLSQNLIESVLA